MISLTDVAPAQWIAQTLLGVSLLIVLVLLVRGAVAARFGARAAYALWALPVLRLFLPPLNMPLPNLLPPTAAPLSMPVPIAAAGPVASLPPGAAADVIVTEAAGLSVGAIVHVLPPVLLAIWAVGAAFVAIRSALRHRALIKVLHADARPVSPALRHHAGTIAGQIGLKQPPRLIASLVSASPFVTGLTRPICALPAWFETDFTADEQTNALTHEFMHVKRADLWALHASELMTAVFWFNPLIWIAREPFRTDLESACDADVLARTAISPHAYGATLLKAARGERRVTAPLVASLPLTHALKERLTRMKDPVPNRLRWLLLGGAGLAAAAIMAASVTVSASAHPTRQQLDIKGTAFAIDGATVENRRFEMLGAPVAPPVPPVPPVLSEAIAWPAEDLDGGAIDVHVATDMDFQHDFQFEIAAISADMAVEGAEIGRIASALALAEMRGDTAKASALEAELARREASIEAHAAEVERKAAAFESRMEAWGAQFEARMEARSARAEAAVEAAMAEREAAAGAYEAEISESNIAEEAAFAEHVDAMHDLANDCRDAELSAGETRVLEIETPTGKTHKAKCTDTTAGE
jgi:beta-lactamase regulating signal transducer with metallopeptidase domain